MIRPLQIALNEVRLYLRDKGDLAFSLLLPIVTFTLLYGAFGGDELFEGTAYIVNEDPEGHYSSLLVDRIGEIESLNVQVLAPETADAKLERSDVLLVLYIPAGFSGKLAAGQPASLTFKQRGNGGQEGQIVAGIIRGLAEDITQEMDVRNQVGEVVAGAGITADRIEATVAELLEEEKKNPAITVREEVLGSSPDVVNQYLPGIITMYVLFSITLSARVIVEERQRGTLERLLTTRLSTGELFFGKFLANIFRGFVQTFILLVLSYIVFNMFTPLSFALTLFVALVFTAAAGALGLIIASVSRSADGASWTAVVFTMSTVMLGGTFFTISEGSALATISKFSVNTYANDALKAIISEGASLANIGFELLVLAGVTVAGLIISRLVFRAVPGGK